MKQKLIALLTAVAFVATGFTVVTLNTGCAGGYAQVEKTLGSPAQVQADITAIATVAKAHTTNAKVLADVHRFAGYLNTAADLDVNFFAQFIPSTGNVNVDALIGAARAYLQAAVSKWGSHNPNAIAYAHAVGNGVLAGGF